MTKKNNVEILHKEKTNIENDSEIEHKRTRLFSICLLILKRKTNC
jgi:hypothetical protein